MIEVCIDEGMRASNVQRAAAAKLDLVPAWEEKEPLALRVHLDSDLLDYGFAINDLGHEPRLLAGDLENRVSKFLVLVPWGSWNRQVSDIESHKTTSTTHKKRADFSTSLA